MSGAHLKQKAIKKIQLPNVDFSCLPYLVQ